MELAVSQANAKGITVAFSAGDGADEVVENGSRTADFPATMPDVTALGGTSLFIGKTNNYLGEGYWSTEKYLRKGTGWDLAHPIFNGGGGGGDSFTYDEPAWQKGVVPDSYTTIGRSSPGRVVPDISLVGDPITGYLVGQTQAQAGGQNSYSEFRIGGTSVSCPLLAAILADTIEANKGGSLGNINPVLYKAAGSSAYRDITAPQKQVAVVRYDYADPSDPTTALVPSLRTLGNLGTLHLRKGYDDATGLGTPNGGKFIAMLAKG
jgi:subtilase family serine protease